MSPTPSPLFSIIVPIYNVKKYLEITIQSVLGQTYPNFELLAIDDGSTDGSSELIDKFAENDSRIRVFHQPNLGVSAARNRGLDEARGEWIVFVDGDDALRCDALEILSDCIRRNSCADLIGYQFIKVDNIASDNDLRIVEKDNNYIERVHDCTHNTCFTALNHYMVWTETYRLDMLKDLRFKNLKNGEDVLFCNEAATRANCYVEINVPIYLYLQRNVSARNNKWTLRRLEDYTALHNGIMRNLSDSKKTVNSVWIKRWIGNLLQYIPSINDINFETRKKFFNKHISLLKQIKGLTSVPRALKIWIATVTMVKSETYFKFTAILPMKLYSKLPVG